MTFLFSYLQYRDTATEYKTWIGTAWVLNKNGYLVTADHAVKRAKVLNIFYKGRFYNAYVIARDSSNDIAIIKIFTLDFTSIPVSLQQNNTQNIAILGFGDPDHYGYKMHMFTGTATLGVFKSSIFTHSLGCHGDSGGPIINNYGNAVGVFTFLYDDSEVKQDKLCATQGGGAPIQYVIDLAQQNGIELDRNIDLHYNSFKYWFNYYKDSVLLLYGES